MSFASLTEKIASYRTSLVRVSIRRDVTASISSLGGGTYGMTFNMPIKSAYYGNTLLTKVTTLSGNNQFTHNEATGAFVMQLSSFENDMYLDYYMFFTSNEGVSWYETPTDSASSMRDWEPRLTDDPTISASVEDILQGVFSISEISIGLVNVDRYFQDYFTSQDSWSNGDCEVWFYIDSPDNIQKVYNGKISDVSFGDKDINLSVYDSLSKLDQPAYMGDEAATCILGGPNSYFTQVKSSSIGKSIKYLLGKSTPYNEYTHQIDSPNTSRFINKGLEAHCSNFDNGNDEFILCRTNSTGIKQITHSAPTSSLNPADSYNDYNLFYNFASHNLEIGDTVQMFQAPSTTYYGYVCHIGAFTWLGNNYNVAIRLPTSYVPTTLDSTLVAPGSHGGNPIVGLLRNNVIYPLMAGYDYDYDYITLPSGNLLHGITLISGWENNDRPDPVAEYTGTESTLTSIDPFNVENDVIFFKFTRNSSQNNHADCVKELCESAGMTTNTTSFTAAESALNVEASLMIPGYDSDSFESYREYIERIVVGAPGYVYLNLDNEVCYTVIDTLSSTETIDNDVIIDNSIDVSHTYKDLLNDITFINKDFIDDTIIASATSPVDTVSDIDSKRLHGFNRAKTIEHSLLSITGQSSSILSIRSKPQTIYALKTATKHLNAVIGSDVTIENDQVLGGSGSVVAKIIGYQKTIDNVTLKLTTLEGV